MHPALQQQEDNVLIIIQRVSYFKECWIITYICLLFFFSLDSFRDAECNSPWMSLMILSLIFLHRAGLMSLWVILVCMCQPRMMKHEYRSRRGSSTKAGQTCRHRIGKEECDRTYASLFMNLQQEIFSEHVLWPIVCRKYLMDEKVGLCVKSFWPHSQNTLSFYRSLNCCAFFYFLPRELDPPQAWREPLLNVLILLLECWMWMSLNALHEFVIDFSFP